ncbi:hypothetical protein A2U01_0003265, partial [Trifolium medium]|nr:hypothetical protein [Trifolium medium]
MENQQNLFGSALIEYKSDNSEGNVEVLGRSLMEVPIGGGFSCDPLRISPSQLHPLAWAQVKALQYWCEWDEGMPTLPFFFSIFPVLRTNAETEDPRVKYSKRYDPTEEHSLSRLEELNEA